MDFASMAKYTPLFVKGLKVTVQISFVAVFIGVIVGLFMALLKLSSIKVLSWAANIYIQIIRGTPVLVQLYIIYSGTYPLFGFNIPPYIAAIVTFGLNSSAYVAEIIRSGIQSVDKGQTEASRSLGLTSNQTMRHIIMPQAVKNILPAMGNEFVTLIKETSVASTIGVADLMYASKIVQSTSFQPFDPLVIVAGIYFIFTFSLSQLIGVFERRLAHND